MATDGVQQLPAPPEDGGGLDLDPGPRANRLTSAADTIRIGRIEIFPIKSLDGVVLRESAITAGGILENDRVYAIVDEEGAFVNGKRTPRIHDIRCEFAPSLREISVWETGQSARREFSIANCEPLNRWLSDFFGFRVSLKHEPSSGFPDDSDAFGPTIVSDASLREVQSWYPAVSLTNVRRRFRTNVELQGGEAFCEDGLFGAPGELKPFQLGSVRILGHNPCQRCVVPTRDPETGDVIRGFQKSFATLRQKHLPPWADARRFNHFYRFALNTSIPAAEAGKRLRVGDPLMA
ncbi:MAG TPA: MOSC N-terminal beta barrel domain-containing protein [Polyangia bacterium]|jgi:uncharacterized protein YcbX|nr:MOSC N-terminal beta barrel domain-containing protein [Polyangia bacterium]